MVLNGTVMSVSHCDDVCKSKICRCHPKYEHIMAEIKHYNTMINNWTISDNSSNLDQDQNLQFLRTVALV